MPNPRRQDRELDQLYANLPRMECQGFCHDSCGEIDMSVRERARISERAGAVTCGAGASCSMLTSDRRCSVYDIRPMICRLWGLTRTLRCPYGCVPEGGFMSERDAMRAALEADRIGGSCYGVDVQEGLRLLDAMSDEELSRLVSMTFARGRATIEGRVPTLQRTGLRAPFEQPGLPVGETAVAFPKRVA